MMPRTIRTLSLEVPVLAVVLLLAIGLRWGALDWPPLAPGEASSALAALRLTPDAAALDPSAGPPASAAYGALTAMLFEAFGAGDALARAVPAVAGVALLIVALGLRPALGPGTAFLTALVLACSPASC
jgi:predicted membrane-bound mannosyltransferase